MDILLVTHESVCCVDGVLTISIEGCCEFIDVVDVLGTGLINEGVDTIIAAAVIGEVNVGIVDSLSISGGMVTIVAVLHCELVG